VSTNDQIKKQLGDSGEEGTLGVRNNRNSLHIVEEQDSLSESF